MSGEGNSEFQWVNLPSESGSLGKFIFQIVKCRCSIK